MFTTKTFPHLHVPQTALTFQQVYRAITLEYLEVLNRITQLELLMSNTTPQKVVKDLN
ncbi:MAG: hypothetical protein ACUVQ8_08145 [Nitrososphaeria archaeon]